ncbi:MAG: hypothetical protein KIT17_02805, partial [Rubrivivax sp.]|nr:hypothetical protein [Rubrivivax sp.]
ALAAAHAAWADRHRVALVACGLDGLAAGTGRAHRAFAGGGTFDIVVNATSSSLAGAQVPVPAAVLRPGTLALDMMYGPAAEPFLQWARDAGATPRDGLGMLVEQAAEAFLVFRGVMPEVAPVLAALRARLQAEKAAADEGAVPGEAAAAAGGAR